MSGKSARARPSLEVLEDRLPLARTSLVVDFTPSVSRQDVALGTRAGNFVDLFRPPAAAGAPRFLDFDRDGLVTDGDAALAAQAVVGGVRQYFAPFLGRNVEVVGVELDQNLGLSRRMLRQARRARGRQVFVIDVGGSEPDANVFGRSPQAARRFNFEGVGRAYADSIAGEFFTSPQESTPERFARFTASVVAHEMGHLLGLGHPLDEIGNRDSLMSPSRRRGVGDSFVNRAYLAEVYPRPEVLRTRLRAQNPFQELLQSFRGQPDELAPGGPANARDVRHGPGRPAVGGLG
jgi:hypothetical protein